MNKKWKLKIENWDKNWIKNEMKIENLDKNWIKNEMKIENLDKNWIKNEVKIKNKIEVETSTNHVSSAVMFLQSQTKLCDQKLFKNFF